jgi:predicted amidohydrolase YtcJ
LSPGYLADLLVLEQDPLNCDISLLKQIRPTATMLGGKWVYQA